MSKFVQVIPLDKHSNLASIISALRRLGFRYKVLEESGQLDSSAPALIPGLGTFGKAIDYLRATGLEMDIRRHGGTRAPLVGICLGMQILCEFGTEDGAYSGLGIFSGRVEPLSTANQPVALNVGWRTLHMNTVPRSLGNIQKAYFAHSYHLSGYSQHEVIATSQYEEKKFAAIVRNGLAIGFQFHPELSGDQGLTALQSVLEDTSPILS